MRTVPGDWASGCGPALRVGLNQARRSCRARYSTVSIDPEFNRRFVSHRGRSRVERRSLGSPYNRSMRFRAFGSRAVTFDSPLVDATEIAAVTWVSTLTQPVAPAGEEQETWI
jgi:hypothetical protein